eukprot:173940_1
MADMTLEGDAQLAAQLQAMEDQSSQAAALAPQQQVIVVNQQGIPIQQMNVHPQVVVVTDIKPAPNTTYKDWYLLSIKNKQHNKCSCAGGVGGGCNNISAYSAAMGWLGYDLGFCIVQIFGWFIANGAHDLSWLFLILFLLLAATNVMTIMAINKFVKVMVIVKLPLLIVSCILV